MNKLTLIALAALVIVGLSYQAKKNSALPKVDAVEQKNQVSENVSHTAPSQPESSTTVGNTPVKDVTAVGGTTPSSEASKTVPEKQKDNCFAFEYRHKKEARDQDIENFLDYTNAFPLAQNFNAKSVCVKVNQKAVGFTLA